MKADFEYFAPKTVRKALSLLSRYQGKIKIMECSVFEEIQYIVDDVHEPEQIRAQVGQKCSGVDGREDLSLEDISVALHLDDSVHRADVPVSYGIAKKLAGGANKLDLIGNLADDEIFLLADREEILKKHNLFSLFQ